MDFYREIFTTPGPQNRIRGKLKQKSASRPMMPADDVRHSWQRAQFFFLIKWHPLYWRVSAVLSILLELSYSHSLSGIITQKSVNLCSLTLGALGGNWKLRLVPLSHPPSWYFLPNLSVSWSFNSSLKCFLVYFSQETVSHLWSLLSCISCTKYRLLLSNLTFHKWNTTHLLENRARPYNWADGVKLWWKNLKKTFDITKL